MQKIKIGFKVVSFGCAVALCCAETSALNVALLTTTLLNLIKEIL